MPNGIVKWFNNAKGYGFIVPHDGGDDLFAHFSAVTMDGYKTLSAGDQVQFDVTMGDKGPQATNIVTTGAGSIAAAPAGGEDQVSSDSLSSSGETMDALSEDPPGT